MSFYPYKTLWINEPMKVITPVVKAGEMLFINLEYEKFTDKPSDINKQLINGMIHTYEKSYSNLPKGKHKYTYGMVIPKFLSPGKYKVVFTVSYEVNPFRTVTKTFSSEEFTVTR